jgi:hypothetical protein
MSITARKGIVIPGFIERHYTTYLIIVATAGWALASYDFNLLVITFPDIAISLDLSATFILLFTVWAGARFSCSESFPSLWSLLAVIG